MAGGTRCGTIWAKRNREEEITKVVPGFVPLIAAEGGGGGWVGGGCPGSDWSDMSCGEGELIAVEPMPKNIDPMGAITAGRSAGSLWSSTSTCTALTPFTLHLRSSLPFLLNVHFRILETRTTSEGVPRSTMTSKTSPPIPASQPAA